ncbi:MAG TPA: aminotransferase class I/II-fold pyridoxal phosphate-dependent enzyme [Spirochaetia bacterium]|nr:aminotransferase class I/II-fold pyridoxal phosphate-dependent enzyme [Spirochaetia bacterium]
MDIFEKCYSWGDAREAQEKGLYPYFKPIQESRGTRVVMEGKELIMAGSNNYLGLSWDPRVKEAAIAATRKWGTSCSGSRFLNGTLALHEELEERLAHFVGRERALCFSTGYQTNLGAISALLAKDEHIFSDRLNHASIVDGIFLASGMRGKVRVHRYQHNNMDSLEKFLGEQSNDDPKLIVTDGVFSMEGDIVKLPRMRELCRKYGARLYLDEAHAIGVLGKTGRGTEEHYGVSGHADVIMCTFSKSFGSLGGFVAGDDEVIDYIKHFGRPLIFSASMPPATIASVSECLTIIEKEPERVQRLQAIGHKMVAGFKSLGFNVGTAETPIVPLFIGEMEKTLLFWRALFDGGVFANPVLSPAVPPDSGLIRTSYMAIHTDDELDRVLSVAGEAGRKLGVLND